MQGFESSGYFKHAQAILWMLIIVAGLTHFCSFLDHAYTVVLPFSSTLLRKGSRVGLCPMPCCGEDKRHACQLHSITSSQHRRNSRNMGAVLLRQPRAATVGRGRIVAEQSYHLLEPDSCRKSCRPGANNHGIVFYRLAFRQRR